MKQFTFKGWGVFNKKDGIYFDEYGQLAIFNKEAEALLYAKEQLEEGSYKVKECETILPPSHKKERPH